MLSLDQWTELRSKFGLSTREYQAAQLLLTGANERAVAQSLALSAHTVHTYVLRLYQKVGVSSRTQLAVLLLTSLNESRIE